MAVTARSIGFWLQSERIMAVGEGFYWEVHTHGRLVGVTCVTTSRLPKVYR